MNGSKISTMFNETDLKDIRENRVSRRDLLKTLGIGTTAGALGLFGFGTANAAERETPNYARGLPALKITKVTGFITAPQNANLVVVKIETSEPGLYGLGCATFTQRASVVMTAIEDYIAPFLIGKDPDNIEDLWQSSLVSSYWRNGPVLNNAISGMDEALWDIKGKRAGMPVYQLLGGRSRFAAPAYTSVGGATPEETADNVAAKMAEGYRYVKISVNTGGPAESASYKAAGYGYEGDRFIDVAKYVNGIPRAFEAVRKRCGEDVELIHDIHEKIQPMDAIYMMNKVEEFRPFYIEDPLSPENAGWWPRVRQATNVPVSMGELFNNVNEFIDPMISRSFEFVRCHLSQIGGITPAMKIAKFGELLGIRMAWHGPGDVAPVGHAANTHINLAIWNLGVNEGREMGEREKEVFPGSPEMKNGHMYVNEAPGLGVEFNEQLAAKYPPHKRGYQQLRTDDGTIVRP